MQKRAFNQWIAVISSLAFSLSVAAASLPAELKSVFSEAHIPLGDVSLWVAPVGSKTPVLSYNEKKEMQPASCAKLVTTLAALELLGPNYRWKTQWRADSFDAKTGAVKGLTYVGGGDPYYVIERPLLCD